VPASLLGTDVSHPDEIASLVREVVGCLDEIAGLDRIWSRGVVHLGGPHYRLKGTLGPVSLGEDECVLFGRLIQEFHPGACFIIGNAFGMSSVFIAKMMELHSGRSVITLDSKSEGDGKRCFETALRLSDRMGCRILKNKCGWSPQDIDKAVESPTYDLIFIDGDHSHPQATRDFLGVQHLVGESTIVCWHDYWMNGVPESVEEARHAGYHCLKVNSSCEMVFGTRSDAVFRRLQSVFSNNSPLGKRYRLLAWMKLYRSLLTGAVRIYLTRR
jgi:predicted O-methyltransferase YrrM